MHHFSFFLSLPCNGQRRMFKKAYYQRKKIKKRCCKSKHHWLCSLPLYLNNIRQLKDQTITDTTTSFKKVKIWILSCYSSWRYNVFTANRGNIQSWRLLHARSNKEISTKNRKLDMAKTSDKIIAGKLSSIFRTPFSFRISKIPFFFSQQKEYQKW